MPLLCKHTDPVWGVWKLNETIEELCRMLRHKSWYEAFLAGTSPDKRKKEWLACRVLLRELVGEEWRVDYRSTGAPYLPESPLQVSFSHTKGYVAVIVGKTPVAIDIEFQSQRILKIRSKFMHPDEEAALDSSHETEHLLLHWCAKETLFKLIGREEVDFRDHLHILPFPYHPSGHFSARETRTPEQNKFRISYISTPDFVLTYSSLFPVAEKENPEVFFRNRG
ncbi:MAG: 4'-phosphopantetheinyl transferase superfamily protein [Tannerellaceae bacterium]|nr:4'-phosphopantetheinyl transferase superfamily protein [Tannerellaceae bacterium]